MSNELKLQLIPSRQRIDIPKHVAVCPYCDGEVALFAECSSWSECQDGTWKAETIELDCTNQPEIEEGLKGAALRKARAELNHFIDQHCVMPYVYWLPVQQRVELWINSTFRFDMGK
jgi:hypothetical protein